MSKEEKILIELEKWLDKIQELKEKINNDNYRTIK